MMAKTELYFEHPIMNAAGTLGFAPDFRSPVDFPGLGAFVTNPVSWLPRTPAKGDRYLPFLGGFLLHTGHPNPGFKKVIRQYARRWSESRIPVIVHLLAQDADTLSKMVERLEGIEGVMGIEVGLPPGLDLDMFSEMIHAAIGELAVIVKVPFEHIERIHSFWQKGIPSLLNTGIRALSLASPRGLLSNEDGQFVSGRLYGPSLFPQALSAVRYLSGSGIPIIGAGGVCSQADVDMMLAAGAMAVQLDSVLWRGGFS